MAIGINDKVKVFTLIIGEEEVCRNTDSEFIANFFKNISDQEDGFLGGPSCCNFSDDLYTLLCLARDERDALKYARYARIIANLQINEEVYNDEI